MKSRMTCITALSLFAALAIPVQLAAQHTRYKLIDLGTLGGPNSATNGGPPSMINNGGVVAGMADTTAPCAYLGGVLSPAVKWEKGVPINLGLLPGGCFSLPNSINGKGMIVGSGDIGVLDPITNADGTGKKRVNDSQVILTCEKVLFPSTLTLLSLSA